MRNSLRVTACSTRRWRPLAPRPGWLGVAAFGLFFLFLTSAPAQELDHKTEEYRVTDSFEFGYRSVFVSGDRDMYRSSVNYNNGFRLFDGMLRVSSNNGHGLIDNITLNTFGTGGDPYQSSSLRVEKYRWFDFNMGYRIIDYRNNLLSLSGGAHSFNTEHILGNYDLLLFPRRRLEIVLGYDRSNENGPAVTSENFNVLREPAFPRDQFSVFTSNLHQVNNQWRGGANLTLAGIKLSFLQGLNYYKQDPLNTNGVSNPALLAGGTVPATFSRSDPIHGSTPFSRLNIHTDANRAFSVNGRFVYSGGSRNFVLNENVGNPSPVTGLLITRQDYVLGAGQRTQGAGDLTLSWQPGERWAFSNTSSINQTRITGDSSFLEVRAPISSVDPGINQLFFDLFSIRLITNSTDVNFRLSPKIGFYGGYHYSIRRIQDRELIEDISGIPSNVPLYSITSVQNAGILGVRLHPIAPLSLIADVEYDHASKPVTPVSDKNYHAETAKIQWKHNAWLASASFKEFHNRNQPTILPDAFNLAPTSAYDSESRQYSADVAWSPAKPYGFDAGYTKLHLDTTAGILNFPVAGLADVAGRRDLYLSNIHYGHLTFRWEVRKRATLFAGYSIVKDTATPQTGPITGVISSTPPAAAPFGISYPNLFFNGTDVISAYPLTYHSPQFRLTIKLNKSLAWNAGWQYYGYNEKFTGVQNYHANIAYTSFRWSF